MFYKNKTFLFCYFYKTSIIIFYYFLMNQNTLKARNTQGQNAHYTGRTHTKVHVQDEQKQ